MALLRSAGHDVYATTATGVGDRVHLGGSAVDLDTHITDVVNVLGFEDLTDVTLVGWSYGGMIITGVAEQVPERVAGLMYLDALVPVDGENSYHAELSSEEVRADDPAAAKVAGLPGFVLVGPYVDWLRSLMPDPADRGVAACKGSCPSRWRPTRNRSEWTTRRPRRCLVPSCTAPKTRKRGTRSPPSPPGSGRLRLALPRIGGQPPGPDQHPTVDR